MLIDGSLWVNSGDPDPDESCKFGVRPAVEGFHPIESCNTADSKAYPEDECHMITGKTWVDVYGAAQDEVQRSVRVCS